MTKLMQQVVLPPEEEKIKVQQEEDRPIIISAYRNLLRSIKTPLNEQDKSAIRTAFEMAANAHVAQRRK